MLRLFTTGLLILFTFPAFATVRVDEDGTQKGYVKNLNFIGATVTRSGIDADIEISGGGASSPLTTKGDIWGFTTEDARIPVGTNDQILKADSTAALGVSWTSVSSLEADTLDSVAERGATTDVNLTIDSGSMTNAYLNLNSAHDFRLSSTATDTFKLRDVTHSLDRWESSDTAFTINPDGADNDTIIEGDTDTDLFYVNAGDDDVIVNGTSITSPAKFGVNNFIHEGDLTKEITDLGAGVGWEFTNVVGFYKHNETTGTTVANEQGTDGTSTVDTSSLTTATSWVGTAFDYGTGSVWTEYDLSTKVSGNATWGIGFAFKTPPNSTYETMYAEGDKDVGNVVLGVTLNPTGTVRFGLQDGGSFSTVATSTNAYDDNVQHTVWVVKYSSTSWALIIDGGATNGGETVIGTGTKNEPTASKIDRITSGRNACSLTEYSQAIVDTVIVTTDAPTEATIKEWHNARVETLSVPAGYVDQPNGVHSVQSDAREPVDATDTTVGRLCTDGYLWAGSEAYLDGDVTIGRSVDADVIINTDHFVLEGSSGNVGIGTATPSANLDIKAGTASIGQLLLNEGTLLTTPVAGMLEFADDRLYVTNIGTQRAIDRTSDVKTTTTTVTNTTTETTVFTGLVPANSLVAGNVLKLIISGDISNASAADIATIRVKVGSSTFATITSPGSSLSNDCWHASGVAVLRSVGASGSMAWHIDLDVAGSPDDDCGVDTIDTTSAENITVTAQWNNAKTGNILTCTLGMVEYKN